MLYQASFEYIVMLSIGLGILTAFLVISILYSNSFSQYSSSQQFNSLLNSLISNANTVASQGVGSSISFNIQSNGVGRNSYFCGKSVFLFSGQNSLFGSSDVNISGLLPISTGNYIAYAKYEEINGYPEVYIGLNSNIYMVNSSYILSSNTLNYTLEFYNLSNSLVPVAFNISVYSFSGAYLGGAMVSSTGESKGSVSLSSSVSNAIVSVFIPAYNLIYNNCVV